MSTSVKTCKDCETPLPITEFYKHSAMGDGHLNKCKACVKARVTRHRDRNIERIREYDVRRAKTPKRKAHLSRQSQKFRKECPEKYAAHCAVNNAVRDGRLNKPDACERCGAEIKLHGHHEDYSNILDVVWLCPACHAERHKEINAAHIKRLNKDWR